MIQPASYKGPTEAFISIYVYVNDILCVLTEIQLQNLYMIQPASYGGQTEAFISICAHINDILCVLTEIQITNLYIIHSFHTEA